MIANVERMQFTFYRSYYEAISVLPKKDQTAVLLAVCAYALDNKEPNLSGTAKAVFTLIRPTLDTSRRKSQSGKKGGENGSKTEANGKQNGSKTEAKPKQTASEKEGEIEVEKEVENDSSKKSIKKSSPSKEAPAPVLPDYSGTTFSPAMVAKVNEWLRYKQERRDSYGPTGLKSLITEIQNNVNAYGESAVMDVITKSMAANYAGIVFDRLKNGQAKPQPQKQEPQRRKTFSEIVAEAKEAGTI